MEEYLDEIEKNKIEVLRKAIQEGNHSGINEDFDPVRNLANLKANRRLI